MAAAATTTPMFDIGGDGGSGGHILDEKYDENKNTLSRITSISHLCGEAH